MSEGGDGGFRLGFRPALDGLRGVAVLTVVLHHAFTFLVPGVTEDGLIPGAFVTVDIFFVLSGFLITSLLLQEHRSIGDIRLRRFWLRRAARLLPALAFLLAGVTVYVLIANLSLTAHVTTVLVVSTYTANWAIVDLWDLTPGFGHIWTLSVEEQFYLLWPPTVMLCLRRGRGRPRLLLGVVAAGIVLGTTVRAWLWLRSGNWAVVYFRSDARVDQLLWGALLAVACRFGWVRPRDRNGWALVAGAVLVAFIWLADPKERLWYLGGATITCLATMGVIATAMDGTGVVGRWLALRGNQWLGRISYSLYLWHVPVDAAVLRYLPRSDALVKLAVALPITFALAVISRRFVEVPFLAIKERWSAAGGDRGAAVPQPRPASP